ncbi:MAG: hypothetical protein ABIL86_04905 [candidate division WOR-3 bacterium]
MKIRVRALPVPRATHKQAARTQIFAAQKTSFMLEALAENSATLRKTNA